MPFHPYIFNDHQKLLPQRIQHRRTHCHFVCCCYNCNGYCSAMRRQRHGRGGGKTRARSNHSVGHCSLWRGGFLVCWHLFLDRQQTVAHLFLLQLQLCLLFHHFSLSPLRLLAGGVDCSGCWARGTNAAVATTAAFPRRRARLSRPVLAPLLK
jgi:hypothetical protein